MVFIGNTGRGYYGRLWHRVLFWALLIGGVVLSIGTIGYGARANDQRLLLITFGMIAGGLSRFVVGKVRREV
jgi:hypothetical protein